MRARISPSRRSRARRLRALKPLVVLLAYAVLALAVAPAAATDPVSPPSISLSISGAAGSSGWYRSSVTVAWTVSDPTGISGSSGCGTTVLSNETAGTTLTCSASNNADPPLSSSVSVTIRIDKTPPDVTAAAADRPPDSNGWYNHALTYSFTGTDALSGLAGCSPATYAGPDGEAASVAGTCGDKAGNVGTRSFGLRYDATPPAVSADPGRAPDANGWYNHELAVRFTGTDGASGVDSCTSTSYGGPDSEQVSVAGSCHDRAGNTGAGSFGLKYDATPPVLSDVSVATGDGVDALSWKSTADSDTAAVRRLPRGAKPSAAKVVFQGSGQSFRDEGIENGLEYVYSIQTYDQAGNASNAVSVRALPKVLVLRKLPYVPRTSEQPVLRWQKVRGATYYHVQLFRGGKRILGKWPVRPELALQASWAWKGRRYRLGAGTYRWYAWAGKGRRSLARYKRIGTAAFTLVPASQG